MHRTGGLFNSMVDIEALGLADGVADVLLLVSHSGDIVDGSGADFVFARHLMDVWIGG